MCGRVCPQETQCEQKCVRGIKGEPVAIGRLERFVADWHNAHGAAAPKKPAPNGHRVAVVGSGPSGLTCAGDLAKKGYEVTVFEALHTAGGVLVYGIPEFRLPKDIVQKEIDTLKALGVDVQTNMVIGRVLSVDELLEQGYEAVFIGSGAGLPRFMNIPGENLKGVYSANEFLTRVNLMKAYLPGSNTPVERARRVAVVGGGQRGHGRRPVRQALGAEEVSIVYRRSEKELPARAEEVEHAKEEGIVFRLLNNPTRILGDENGNVQGMECIRMELGEPDASGRRRPVEVPGSEFSAGSGLRHHGHRHLPQPADQIHHPGAGDPAVGRHHCGRGDGPDQPGGCVRRGRRGDRRRHGDSGHGRRQDRRHGHRRVHSKQGVKSQKERAGKTPGPFLRPLLPFQDKAADSLGQAVLCVGGAQVFRGGLRLGGAVPHADGHPGVLEHGQVVAVSPRARMFSRGMERRPARASRALPLSAFSALISMLSGWRR